MSNDCFQIGLTQPTMANLNALGVPDPIRALYAEHAVLTVGGDGQTAGDGYPSAVWVWPSITRAAAYRLLELAGVAASVTVYIRTPVNLAPRADAAWVTFEAIMRTPVLTGEDGNPLDAAPDVFENFALRFSRLTVP